MSCSALRSCYYLSRNHFLVTFNILYILCIMVYRVLMDVLELVVPMVYLVLLARRERGGHREDQGSRYGSIGFRALSQYQHLHEMSVCLEWDVFTLQGRQGDQGAPGFNGEPGNQGQPGSNGVKGLNGQKVYTTPCYYIS